MDRNPIKVLTFSIGFFLDAIFGVVEFGAQWGGWYDKSSRTIILNAA